MNIKKCSFFFSLLLTSIVSIFGQSKIDGDLLILSELTLSKSPSIQRNALEIDLAEANYRLQRSTFDYRISSGLDIFRNKLSFFDADPRSQILSGDLETKNMDFSIGLQKKFRTGLLANIGSNYSKVSDNFPFNRFNEEVGANISDQATSATLSLTQPLLRGNGIKVNTAFERSAALDIESAKENFELNTAFEVSQLGNAFWQYVTAFQNLKVYRENEDRVRNVLQITQELVKADKKPESDLVQINADLAQAERQTAVAEQNLYNTRINLGRVIGISEESSQNIGDPLSGFPTILESGFDQGVSVATMTELARDKRTDIRAFQNTREGLELQLSAANNGTLPQLDLNGFYTFGGAAVGGGLRYLNAFENRQGRNSVTGLGLTFTFPINNNLAMANLAKGKIALMDQKIAYQNLLRNIDLNVSIALNNLYNSVLILEKAKETLAYSQLVYNNEQIKFQNGMTTLLNLILFQERLTFAQLEYLQAQQQFAQAIIDLRFETGTLISIDQNRETESLVREIFYTIPRKIDSQ